MRRQLGALATMQGSGSRPRDDLAAHLHDLAARVARVETGSEGMETTASAGDGRFLVELRALDKRLEQMEVSARDDRDVSLAQIERVASRLEWRLQQLEGEIEAPVETGAPSGRIVPIRTSDV